MAIRMIDFLLLLVLGSVVFATLSRLVQLLVARLGRSRPRERP
jgi:hypothetical protein